jgi:hypothetical protein
MPMISKKRKKRNGRLAHMCVWYQLEVYTACCSARRRLHSASHFVTCGAASTVVHFKLISACLILLRQFFGGYFLLVGKRGEIAGFVQRYCTVVWSTVKKSLKFLIRIRRVMLERINRRKVLLCFAISSLDHNDKPLRRLLLHDIDPTRDFAKITPIQ